MAEREHGRGEPKVPLFCGTRDQSKEPLLCPLREGEKPAEGEPPASHKDTLKM